MLKGADLAGWPILPPVPTTGRKKVIVTGCYDWLHSGHVRFFEEVAQLGELYVAVGHDANIRLLKGEGHPLRAGPAALHGQAVRCDQALITSGEGWMDAEPEIAALQPDIYAVNEDGDQPEKRQFCQEHGLEYVGDEAAAPRRAASPCQHRLARVLAFLVLTNPGLCGRLRVPYRSSYGVMYQTSGESYSIRHLLSFDCTEITHGRSLSPDGRDREDFPWRPHAQRLSV